MNFERGKDPKDALGIGASNDAKEVMRVKYYVNGVETIITDPYTIKRFLENLSHMNFTNDPVFGPQRLLITVYGEEYEYTDHTFFGSGRQAMAHTYKKREEIDLTINEIIGGVFEYSGKFYSGPTTAKLAEKHFAHLIDRELQYQKEEKRARQAEQERWEFERKMVEEKMKADLEIAERQNKALMEAAKIKEEKKEKTIKILGKLNPFF